MMIRKSGIFSILLILIIISFLVENSLAQKSLYLQYEWRYLDYQFPTQAIRDSAIRNGQYIKGNSFPIDIDVYYGASGTKQFITMPRFFDGTPITLGVITSVNGEGGPIIAPFPNYEWQQTGNCNGFTSVFRVFVDECQRLWVLDSGNINDQQVCPAQLVVFDLRSTGTAAIFIHKFPSTLIRTGSLFITPVVDVRATCADTMVYIADVTGFGIIVFDFKNNRSWRAESPLLRPNSAWSNFTIAGEPFNLEDGVFGLSVSPRGYTNRQLFFHSLASITENRIALSVLDNPAYWQNPAANPSQFVQFGVRENSQATISAMDKNGNQFFGTLRPLGIGCWDSLLPYNGNLKLVAQSDFTLQFISGLKIVNRNGVQELWVLSCRFQKIIRGTRNINEVNYRVMGITVNELLSQNTRCYGPAFPRY